MAGQMVKCGVSVIRISGSNAFDAVKRMTSEHSAFPEFRKAVVRNILDVDTKEVIDKGRGLFIVLNKSDVMQSTAVAKKQLVSYVDRYIPMVEIAR